MRLLLPLWVGWLLAKRIGIDRAKAAAVCWPSGRPCSLRQGPVFYQMLAVVIPLLLWFDSRKLWRTTLLVALVSVLAGITRINWFPMPGLMAAMLYLMEQPLAGKNIKDLLRYPTLPLGWNPGRHRYCLAQPELLPHPILAYRCTCLPPPTLPICFGIACCPMSTSPGVC